MTDPDNRYVTLNNGVKMPMLFFGTFRIRGYDIIESCLDASIGSGYRGIDTAGIYRNEHEIGEALKNVLLKKHGLQREDIFLTSKLAPNSHGSSAAERACIQSISKLQLEYIDLYLIHWPGTQGIKHSDAQNKENRKQSWLALEKLYKAGKIKALGVSNYTIQHIEELLQYATVKPAVLQVELHPFLTQEPLRRFCADNEIHFQAYSSLGTTDQHAELMNNPVVQECAAQVGRTEAQVLLRWGLQLKASVLPKSLDPGHIADNGQIFDFQIGDDTMKKLSNLHRNKRYCWDPNQIL